MSGDKVIPVKVAVRCRPLIPKEVSDGCQQCLYFVKGEPQVIVGSNRPFTFDYAFSAETSQEDVYDSAVNGLLRGLFNGYNATVLAYGQTGSGKTYSMGSSYHPEDAPDSSTLGIIPRVVKSLFKQANEDVDHEFSVRVSFLELYNEDIIDLFVPAERRETMVLREDPINGIKIPGLKEMSVHNLQETMDLLRQGSVGRTTGATAMNSQSSRSHAIFTIHVDQFNKLDQNDIWKAKFHLVDLAGSERVKKTMATGDRFKEGVNINKGLLMLGNVISALGCERGKSTHIPYRDSKLTRLLQDSLGGNSHTLMIACVSPADNNMEETLNTLRYADRARKIKNKPVVNRDPQAAEILRLRQLVQELQMRNITVDLSSNSEVTEKPGTSHYSSNSNLGKLKSLEEENMKLSHELQLAVAQNAVMCEKVINLEMTRDTLNEKIKSLRNQAQVDIHALNSSLINGDTTQMNEQLERIKGIQTQISELQNTSVPEIKLTDETMNDQISHNYTVSDSKNHALRQAELSRKLQELNKLLATKQELADQISLNDSHMDDMRTKYEETMKQLEENVTKLQAEKVQLEFELKQAKANTSSNKVAENRRKRLQELEAELQKLRKKIAEQNKLVKMKEQSDKQVKKLDIDIKGLKVHRVKLMKQMKEEGDNFRKWKQEKDREVMQLKAKDRKREYQIAKLVQRNEQQKKVLQRKSEEAAAANRRLKEALNKQQRTLEEKRSTKSEAGSIGTRIRKWLNEEIEVLVSVEEAQHHLNELREDRKELTNQLQALNERQDTINTEPPPSKRKTIDGRNEHGQSNDNNIGKQITDIKQDIDLRNAQIQDLQQKILDADQDDDKNKSRWSNVNSMLEAKCAMKHLLQNCVTTTGENARLKSQIANLVSAKSEACRNSAKLEEQLKLAEQEHHENLLILQRDNEQKMLYLLCELKSEKSAMNNQSSDEALKMRCQIQEEAIEKLKDLHDELQKKTAECELLKKVDIHEIAAC
ncbi:chromosome-associated kinesin KIF4A-like [Tubulanus polymorphus]|uniref:chromosome-associated kinesin KIF4A-like n=1 Tax=Tubulanus polymorphus TaxID=672921 RepID=UPI003DA1ED13